MSHGIVRELPAVGRIHRRHAGLKRQHVGQQGARDLRCRLRRIPASMLQRVREGGNEARVVRRLSRYVREFVVPGKERLLRGMCVSVGLSPRSILCIRA